jgi:pyruvate/2-oxoglutarate dehydrogenase complex dihydrolipoamide acyltransferase (E2) component
VPSPFGEPRSLNPGTSPQWRKSSPKIAASFPIVNISIFKGKETFHPLVYHHFLNIRIATTDGIDMYSSPIFRLTTNWI